MEVSYFPRQTQSSNFQIVSLSNYPNIPTSTDAFTCLKNYFSFLFQVPKILFMKQLVIFIFAVIGYVNYSHSQTLYNGTSYGNGLTTVFKTVYSGSSSITSYGIKEDKTGDILLPVEYDFITASGAFTLLNVKTKSGRYKLFSAKTKSFITPEEYNSIGAFSDGLAIVSKDSSYNNRRYGAIDTTGKIVIPISYPVLRTYQEGLMAFTQKNLMGFINANNQVIIEPTYYYVSNFSNGLACAKAPKDSVYGYINKSNKWAITPQFKFAEEFKDGYATVSQRTGPTNKAQYGTINTKGKIVVPVIYDNITARRSGGTFVYTLGKEYGIIDSTGNILTEKNSRFIPSYNGDLITIKYDTLSGIINNRGKWLYKPEYKAIVFSILSGAAYLQKGDTYTVINKLGNTVLKPVEANKIELRKNRFMVVYNDKITVHDNTGKLLQTINYANIDAQYTTMNIKEDSVKISYKKSTSIYNLSNNTNTPLNITDAYDFTEEGYFLAKNSQSKYDFFDINGQAKTNKKYSAATSFSKGYAVTQTKTGDTAVLIDANFKEIKKSAFLNGYAGIFSEGLAQTILTKGVKYAFIDTKGDEVFSIAAMDVGDCIEGRIWIKKNNTSIIYVTNEGIAINKDTYTDVRQFNEGVAPVKKNGKWAVINRAGEYVLEPNYDNMSAFLKGVAIVQAGNDYYLVNKEGKRIDNNNYTSAGAPENGYVQVKKGDKAGIIDTNGNLIISFDYDFTYIPYEGVAWVQKGKKIGAVDLSNKVIIPFEYDNVSNFKDGYAHVVVNNNYGLINKQGKVLLPLVFETLGVPFKNRVLAIKKSGFEMHKIK